MKDNGQKQDQNPTTPMNQTPRPAEQQSSTSIEILLKDALKENARITKEMNMIRPLSRDAVYKGHGFLDPTQKAWILTSSRIGDARQHPEGGTVFALECRFRFCINNDLKPLSQFISTSLNHRLLLEDLFRSLQIGFEHLLTEIHCNAEMLRCWRIGIISSYTVLHNNLTDSFLDEPYTNFKHDYLSRVGMLEVITIRETDYRRLETTSDSKIMEF